MQFFTEASQLVPVANVLTALLLATCTGSVGFVAGHRLGHATGFLKGKISERLTDSFSKLKQR